MKKISIYILVIFLLLTPYGLISVLSNEPNPLNWDTFFLMWFLSFQLLTAIISTIVVAFFYINNIIEQLK